MCVKIYKIRLKAAEPAQFVITPLIKQFVIRMRGEWKDGQGRRRDSRRIPIGVEDFGVGKGGRKGFVDNIRESTTSFFFTNFPEGASRAKLWTAFASVGEVADVFVPAKVDRRGRRFGFVRFKDVRDLSRLERRLGGVWMGTYKLQVNRSHSTVNGDSDRGGISTVFGPDPKGKKIIGLGKAPVEVVGSEVPLPRWGNVDASVSKSPWGRVNGVVQKNFNMEYQANKERINELNACYVGLLAESKSSTALEF